MRWLAALVVLLAAGCGGSDGQSHEEFANEANRICREGEANVSAIADAAQGGSPEEVAGAIDEAAGEFEPVLQRLRGLEPPEDIRTRWDAFLDDIAEGTELLGEVADAVRTGDRAEGTRLAARYEEIARATKPFAEQYNLDSCLSD
jgi:hypothetical protein